MNQLIIKFSHGVFPENRSKVKIIEKINNDKKSFK